MNILRQDRDPQPQCQPQGNGFQPKLGKLGNAMTSNLDYFILKIATV